MNVTVGLPKPECSRPPELNSRAARSTRDSAAVEFGNPRVKVDLEDLRTRRSSLGATFSSRFCPWVARLGIGGEIAVDAEDASTSAMSVCTVRAGLASLRRAQDRGRRARRLRASSSR